MADQSPHADPPHQPPVPPQWEDPGKVLDESDYDGPVAVTGKPSGWTCSNCGNSNAEGIGECPGCGLLRTTTDPEYLKTKRRDRRERQEKAASAAQRPADGMDVAIEVADLRERVTAMLYLMMRDAMPTGAAHALVMQLAGKGDFKFTDPDLENLARRYADIVLGSEVAIMPKHIRDWLATFPERIRNSPHFADVIGELEGIANVDDRTKAAVTAEVVRRQRAEASRGHGS